MASSPPGLVGFVVKPTGGADCAKAVYELKTDTVGVFVRKSGRGGGGQHTRTSFSPAVPCFPPAGGARDNRGVCMAAGDHRRDRRRCVPPPRVRGKRGRGVYTECVAGAETSSDTLGPSAGGYSPTPNPHRADPLTRMLLQAAAVADAPPRHHEVSTYRVRPSTDDTVAEEALEDILRVVVGRLLRWVGIATSALTAVGVAVAAAVGGKAAVTAVRSRAQCRWVDHATQTEPGRGGGASAFTPWSALMREIRGCKPPQTGEQQGGSAPVVDTRVAAAAPPPPETQPPSPAGVGAPKPSPPPGGEGGHTPIDPPASPRTG